MSTDVQCKPFSDQYELDGVGKAQPSACYSD